MLLEEIASIRENIQKVIVGKEQILDFVLAALLCEGHILIEDVPGVGKTVLAKSLAFSMGCSFRRIQCTPDLLPSDITGTFIFDQRISEFTFRAGPVMANIVLVDEINRATPRTQSSLLESMEERQITVDGITKLLPRPFLVIATQNPVELQGTFPLPEAQLDRFLLRLRLGYPTEDEEDMMLLRFRDHQPLDTLKEATSGEVLMDIMTRVPGVHVDDALRRYILAIVRRTRTDPLISLGASPRASLALYRASQAFALVNGRNYVLPDDIKQLASPVLSHRLMLSSEAYFHKTSKESLIEGILSSTPVPVEN